MQLVTPSVVAIAVRMLMAICRIVFQVFAFIFLMFTLWGKSARGFWLWLGASTLAAGG